MTDTTHDHADPSRYRRIRGLSDERRMPRLGRIRLGEKRAGGKGAKNLAYFIVEADDPAMQASVDAAVGDQPVSLDVMLPLNDVERVFPQAYCLYGADNRLKCKGDGATAARRVCATCRDAEPADETFSKPDHRNAKRLACGHDNDPVNLRWVEVECPCVELTEKRCRPRGVLFVVLPDVSLSGVFQMVTTGPTIIMDINSGIELGAAQRHGHIAMVPARLFKREATGAGHTYWSVGFAFTAPAAPAALAGPSGAPALTGGDDDAFESDDDAPNTPAGGASPREGAQPSAPHPAHEAPPAPPSPESSMLELDDARRGIREAAVQLGYVDEPGAVTIKVLGQIALDLRNQGLAKGVHYEPNDAGDMNALLDAMNASAKAQRDRMLVEFDEAVKEHGHARVMACLPFEAKPEDMESMPLRDLRAAIATLRDGLAAPADGKAAAAGDKELDGYGL